MSIPSHWTEHLGDGFFIFFTHLGKPSKKNKLCGNFSHSTFYLNIALHQEKKSPFCIGTPVFTLAEPEDVDIICGEFDTG